MQMDLIKTTPKNRKYYFNLLQIGESANEDAAVEIKPAVR
jgi:hypothetical protein